MQVISPVTLVDKEKITGPFFYLAGSSKGVECWRRLCCMYIEKRLPEAVVAVPCRGPQGHKPGHIHLDGSNCDFQHQREWRYQNLKLAVDLSVCHKACAIFWLAEMRPREDSDSIRHARDLHVELARWVCYAKTIGGHIVVGANRTFHGLHEIQADLALDLGREPTIHALLASATKEAVDWVTTPT